MADTLSQEEIDALREAVKSGDVVEEADQPVQQEETEQVKVVSYNFRKPHLMSADQLHTLQLLHDAFAKSLQGSMLSALKTQIESKLVAVDQISYSEFVLSVASPTYIALVKTNPDIGSIAIEINTSLIMPLLDILMGSDGSTAIEPRELTQLEVGVFNDVTQLILNEMKAAWAVIADIDFELVLTESNAEYLQLTTPETSCLNIAFDVHLAETTGVISICYPIGLLQAAMKRGRGEGGSSDAESIRSNEMLKALSEAPLDFRAIIGPSQITAGQLGKLKPGDVIFMDRRFDSAIDMYVDDQPFYLAEVGQRRGKIAVNLLKRHSETDDDAVPGT